MGPEEFVHLIQQPNHITPTAVKELQKLAEAYPYFQLAFILLAKAAYDQNPDQAQQAIQIAAIYATDRNYLKLFLERQLPFTTPKQETTLTLSKPSLNNQQEINNTKYSEPDFINNYINTLRAKTAQKLTKRKSLEQLNIIENFIQQGGHFKPITKQNLVLDDALVDLSQENNALSDDLITESLAKVMIKQGKVQRALEIYNKLQLKFPEKKFYFSVLSEKLKKEKEI